MKKLKSHYSRHSVVSIDEVLPKVSSDTKNKVKFNGLLVKCGSLRLRTFQSNPLECSRCHLKATHFALERPLKAGPDESYHLNLYGSTVNGDVLFTHDHTLARSLGGVDDLINTTTMCSPCNQAKAVTERILLSERAKNAT